MKGGRAGSWSAADIALVQVRDALRDERQTATLVLPRAEFGAVGSNWVFTVALTGQDGYSPDQARGFTSTAGAYTFGVCPASGVTAAICSVNPGNVAKVMDTIAPGDQTPGAASQSSEWDQSTGSAVLPGVTVP